MIMKRMIKILATMSIIAGVLVNMFTPNIFTSTATKEYYTTGGYQWRIYF